MPLANECSAPVGWKHPHQRSRSFVSSALSSRGPSLRGVLPFGPRGTSDIFSPSSEASPKRNSKKLFSPSPSPSLSGACIIFFLSKPAQTEVMAFWPRTLVPCLTAPTKHSHHTHMNNHDPARQDPSKHAAFVGPRHGRSDRCSEHGSDLRPPSLFPEPVRPPLTIGVCPPGWAGTAGNCAVTQ
ncbi:hypothetical protein CTAM01_07922 [Colletotrichum tamarilloi]|uniref:Uncharacterized protein n=1 Tax=Colletotrichum tamarilloi TaxID=1209934 RepID=A0ABQ9R827_9PEZI|nr:uncharacterized protein CTAM01_07922 [Colletotrichum tamarilloi]KAK1497258.1 hypothetical protein CTAM01_07922 [Colletotrichum tamarilloi]